MTKEARVLLELEKARLVSWRKYTVKGSEILNMWEMVEVLLDKIDDMEKAIQDKPKSTTKIVYKKALR